MSNWDASAKESDVWPGFIETTFGAGGSITYFANDSAARLNAPVGSNAILSLPMPLIRGGTYTVRFMARCTSGYSSESTRPIFGIDVGDPAELVESFEYKPEWTQHTVTYTVPYNLGAVVSETVIFQFGVFTSKATEIEITRPIIERVPLPYSCDDAIASSGFIRNYKNVTSDRAFNTSYTNNKVRDIDVIVQITESGNGVATFIVNGVTIGYVNVSADPADPTDFMVSFKVPPRGTYRVNSTGAQLIEKWVER